MITEFVLIIQLTLFRDIAKNSFTILMTRGKMYNNSRLKERLMKIMTCHDIASGVKGSCCSGGVCMFGDLRRSK